MILYYWWQVTKPESVVILKKETTPTLEEIKGLILSNYPIF